MYFASACTKYFKDRHQLTERGSKIKVSGIKPVMVWRGVGAHSLN